MGELPGQAPQLGWISLCLVIETLGLGENCGSKKVGEPWDSTYNTQTTGPFLADAALLLDAVLSVVGAVIVGVEQ